MKDAYIKTAKQMYISGNNDNAIASALNVTVRTVQNWRKKAKQSGDDWATVKLAAAMNKEEVEEREKNFLSLLITSFEQTFNTLNEPPASTEEANKRLEILNKYVRSYYLLKAPVKKEDRAHTIGIIASTIKAVADMAIEDNAETVALWLSDRADEITTRIFQKQSF